MLELICIKLLDHHYNDPLAGYFGIQKIGKLLA